jgi:hypothetical protein
MSNKTIEKKFYLCDKCKKVGVKSYNVKTFESFDCPKCKQTTTLFLPLNKRKINVVKDNNIKVSRVAEKTEVKKLIKLNYCTSTIPINFFFFFMTGFVVALFLIKK